jgi:hypothetical protein
VASRSLGAGDHPDRDVAVALVRSEEVATIASRNALVGRPARLGPNRAVGASQNRASIRSSFRGRAGLSERPLTPMGANRRCRLRIWRRAGASPRAGRDALSCSRRHVIRARLCDRLCPRLSGKPVTVRTFPRNASPRKRPGGCSARDRLDPVVVELQQVVGGGDKAPLGRRGGSASSSEPCDRAVVFDLPEDRLDCSSFRVELAAEIG